MADRMRRLICLYAAYIYLRVAFTNAGTIVNEALALLHDFSEA